MRHICAMVTVIAVLGTVRFARGDANLTLAAAQSEARAHAPDAMELEARLRGASAVAADAHRWLRRDPILTGTGAQGINEPGERSFEVGVSWTIDVSGSWAARGASADADRTRVLHEREDGLRALDEAVAITMAEAGFAQRATFRAERIAALFAVASAAARRQLDAGSGTQLDVDAADLDFAGARATMVEARASLDDARVRLGRLLARTDVASMIVEDPVESVATAPPGAAAAIIEEDPRVRAVLAEVDAATHERVMYERLVIPMPTVGVSYAVHQNEIPVGSFTDATAPGLGAAWTDRQATLTLSVPIPSFDRQTAGRVQANARIANAEAHARVVRAQVGAELATALIAYRSAADGYAALAPTAQVLERDLALLDKSIQAGAIDSATRALALRRLAEIGARSDAALRDLRIRRAQLLRRASRKVTGR
jgi:outer membrane protein TolC